MYGDVPIKIPESWQDSNLLSMFDISDFGKDEKDRREKYFSCLVDEKIASMKNGVSGCFSHGLQI